MQRLERPPAEVGPRPVGELVEEVEQQHGIAVLARDLEQPFHDVLPAQQHVPFGGGQLRVIRDELLDHGGPRRQPVLQREMVDGHGEHGLVGHQPAGELPRDDSRELAVEPVGQREVHQHPFEGPRPLDQVHAIPPAREDMTHRPAMRVKHGIGSIGRS